MHSGGHWVEPLETNLLLGVGIGMLLDGIKDARPELSSQGAESTFILERLNHDILQVVHLIWNYSKINIHQFNSVNRN